MNAEVDEGTNQARNEDGHEEVKGLVEALPKVHGEGYSNTKRESSGSGQSPRTALAVSLA